MTRSSNVADDGMRPYKHAATRQQRNHADWSSCHSVSFFRLVVKPASYNLASAPRYPYKEGSAADSSRTWVRTHIWRRWRRLSACGSSLFLICKKKIIVAVFFFISHEVKTGGKPKWSTKHIVRRMSTTVLVVVINGGHSPPLSPFTSENSSIAMSWSYSSSNMVCSKLLL